ncbi:hypothetical protein D1816_08425 [Aquimarina sp. AD10]|uniref:Uncharacterized protein n=1 Tax=Aquimarina aggregata TaxID=1642818 RepID=A0A162XW75_9FLAO|nr:MULTISPECIES: hypothetical protein [Aquimarina]AXT60374.1 hypothetical protein D1816_08425 [Aquimarina sp. AD10]KZS38808.1 hypothetical protein AWE51_14590 [Aquimarina aggregata]RKN01192.1 hypothetical protein D7033_05055 [Aquimarina sp. AD10]
MKDLKKIGKPLNRAQQKDIKGGLDRLPMNDLNDCRFPLAAPPEGCNWHLNLKTCTAQLICSDLAAFAF